MRKTSFVMLLLLAGWVASASAQSPVWIASWGGATLCSPRGVGVAPNGDVFVGHDCGNPHIQHFDANGTFLTAFGGPGPEPGNFDGPPNGLAVDGAGSVYVADYFDNRLEKFTSGGVFITQWPTGVGPVGVAVDADGSVFVVLLAAKRVQKFSPAGALLATIGTTGTGPGQFQDPVGVAVDGLGHVYVADFTRQRVLRFSTTGVFQGEFDTFSQPEDVAVGPDHHLWVIYFNANAIRKFTSAGALLVDYASPNGLDGAYRITVTEGGMMYVTEQYNQRVSQFQVPTITPARGITFGRLHMMYR